MERNKTPTVKRQNKPTGKCYLCSEKATIQHHISYEPEIKKELCFKCHKKIHIIVEQYHAQITKKDKQLQKIKKIIKGES